MLWGGRRQGRLSLVVVEDSNIRVGSTVAPAEGSGGRVGVRVLPTESGLRDNAV